MPACSSVDGEQRLRLTHPLLASAALARPAPRHGASSTGGSRASSRARSGATPRARRERSLDRDSAGVGRGRAARGRPRRDEQPPRSWRPNAARLTPTADSLARARRELDAAGYETQRGDWRGARARLEPLLVTLPAGDMRATVLLRLARLEDTTRHVELCRRAIEEADGASLQAEAHQLAAEGSMMAGDLPSAMAHARIARGPRRARRRRGIARRMPRHALPLRDVHRGDHPGCARARGRARAPSETAVAATTARAGSSGCA